MREASSGTEALAVLDAKRVDLVLADVRLADMSGLAVARRALAHTGRVRVLLMSGYEQEPLTAEFSDMPFVRKPFVLEGDDWFSIDTDRAMSWKRVQSIVAQEHERLVDLIAAIDKGTATSALPDAERAELVLGVTSHAVYHAGQIQLIKRLQEA